MSGGLVLRYNTEKVSDGLPPGEGVFLACSFWMVSALKLQGRDADAKKLFERVLSLANDVGLLAEEYDTGAKRLVGNFPQALSAYRPGECRLQSGAVHMTAKPCYRSRLFAVQGYRIQL